MKPSEITLDMVREAMKNTAAWAKAAGRPYLRACAEDVVWYVHSYVPPVPDNYRERTERKNVLLSADAFGKYNNGPTSSQTQAVRKLLTQLVEVGEVERREDGNSHSFTYMSTEYMLYLQARDELQGRMSALVDRLKQELKSESALVDASIRKQVNGQEYIEVVLRLSEVTARHVLACLEVGRE